MAMTSPPLVSFIGALFSRLRGSRFCYWIMDLNPDEAIAAGWLPANSFAANMLERFSRFSLRQASQIIVLDEFMRKRILDKNIGPQKVVVIPPWTHDEDVRYNAEGREQFRKMHGLTNKFVVMYSGNHSPCHPLNTILDAARKLAANADIAFLFVGGGSQFAVVRKFAVDHSLANVLCLPYQPLSQLSSSLSAADLHLVVMGSPFVGLVHPCKIYNILRIGSPLLYLGPQPSHISEIIHVVNGAIPCALAEHGQVDEIVRHFLALKQSALESNRHHYPPYGDEFSKSALLPRLASTVESVGEQSLAAMIPSKEARGL